MLCAKLHAMLPEGIEANANVTRDGKIKINITLEPEHAPALAAFANMLFKAAGTSQARAAVIKLEKQANRQTSDSARKYARTLERLALSVYRRTKKTALACFASGLKKTDLKFILINARTKEKRIRKEKRNVAIIKACLRGENHTSIGAKYKMHQKSVTRLFNGTKKKSH